MNAVSTLTNSNTTASCPSPTASNPNDDPLARILRLLSDRRRNPKPCDANGKKYMALCPVHDDHNPSLECGRDGDGNAWLKCYAGCSTDDVCTALGIRMSDLFKTAKLTEMLKREVEAYSYHDEKGNLLYQVVRYEPKDFRQRRPDGNGGWIQNVNGVRRVLYRLPQLLDSSPNERVFICEGEKDADRLARGSLIATTCSGGAGKWRRDYSKALLDRDIIILPDNDDAGRKHAEKIADSAHGIAATVRILDLAIEWEDMPEKGDVSDWFNNGGTPDQLVKLADRAAEWKPSVSAGDVAATLDDSEIQLQLNALLENAREKEKPDAIYEAGSLLARLSHSQSAIFKQKAKEILGNKLNLTDLTAIISKCRSDAESAANNNSSKQSVQTQFLSGILEKVDLYHTPDGVGYACIEVDSHQELWGLKDRAFKRWLSRHFYAQTGKLMNSQILQDVILTLEGEAQFGSEECTIHIRVAEHADCVYLDLCNPDWEVVEISSQGWKVINDPPVRFFRTKGMGELPHPKRGGSLLDLKKHINLQDNASWMLCVSWLVTALSPDGPYPLLVLQGEHGSAKSTAARLIRSLVDPSTCPLRSIPTTERDLMIMAMNSLVVSFDNLSKMPGWCSDSLCRLSTGGGFSTRELHTDTDEIIFNARRPIILNGIDDIAGRPDLRDRTIIVNLERIPDHKRREERDVIEQFERDRSQLLGCLCDAISMALSRIGNVKLESMPRMADYAKWVAAAETALPWPAGEFLNVYEINRIENIVDAIEADVVATSVFRFITDFVEWTGTASKLLELLTEYYPAYGRGNTGWPNGPRSLSSKLRKIAPLLRARGVEITFSRKNIERQVTLIKKKE